MSRHNFTATLHADGQAHEAVFIPHMRQNGKHYEINVRGFPRFEMRMSPLGRFDLTDASVNIPYALVLAASEEIERRAAWR